MILVDTSVWIDHFRKGNPILPMLLRNGSVLIHVFTIGEIACGNLKRRPQILADLRFLPRTEAATDEEVFALLEKHRLWGQGIGWIDAHLVASALLSNCELWTLDKKLSEAAEHVAAKVFHPR